VRRALVLVVVLLACGLCIGAVATRLAGANSSYATESRCGVERWAVKTLTDPDARSVKFKAKATTIRGLRRRRPPATLGATRNPGVEMSTFRVRASLVEMKIEEDEDIHLVVSQPGSPRLTMIVEFPALGCTKGATAVARRKMRTARSALVRACGAPNRSHFTDLTGKATITGVGFFDRIHGQTGIAPNGIELHPVLSFVRASCKRSASAPPSTPPPAAPSSGRCDPSYPTVCLPPPPPDLNCADVPFRNFKVLPPDPHHFDGDKDGIGCES
jgi:hypothetical protein